MAKDEKPKVFKFTARDGSEFIIGDAGKHLELTPDKIAESLREQAARASSSPHVLLSPSQAHINQAQRLSIDWLEAARAVEQELHQKHTKLERKQIKARYNHLMKLLAESLVTLGQYEEAFMVLPKHEVELKRTWKQEYTAIWRNDDARCSEKCEKAFAADPTVVTRERVVRHVNSQKHGRLITLIACTSCGMLNARPPDGELAKQIEARAKAVAMLPKPGRDGKVSKEAVERARAQLTQAGLTAEKVLKL